MELDFTNYVRKPFVVDAVEITEANIEQVAPYIGDIKTKEDGSKYILVDNRLVPNVTRVYPGFFLTKMGENVRCYSRKIFREQFVPTTPEMAAWIEYLEAHGGVEAPAMASEVVAENT